MGERGIILVIPWSRDQRYIIYIHHPKKLLQNRIDAFFYCKLHVLPGTWKQHKELARTLSMYLDRIIFTQARRKTNSHVIYRSLTKKIKQHMAHGILNREFDTFYLVWQDFKEPVTG